MLQRKIIGALGAALVLIVSSHPAAAATLDTGNTAWMLTATGLVLFMTLPGLALFYGGLVHARNVLSVLMHCFAVACLVSVLWAAVGYTLAFRGEHLSWLGTTAALWLRDLAVVRAPGNFPESVFAMYQMTFAIITPALIIGTFPERISFPFILGFTGLWLLLVYVPVAHWVWGGGWLADRNVIDFAGGIVVHTTAGVSALVAALMVGPRHGFPNHVPPPHNPGMTMAGAAMLWVGWFGFNAGSALAADASAGNAMLATHLAAAAGALTWMVIEWARFGKPSSVGLVTGMVAGLATITPASGYTGPLGAVCIGIAAGIVCFLAVRAVKIRFKVDDSLDVFGVHGVGGMLGSLLVAATALPALGGAGLPEGMTAESQFGVQVLGVAAAALWSAVATWAIVKLLAATTGVRVALDQEREGLDLAAHGERAYDLTQG
ncbi:MAG TPA: ammonium transporter [Alphaproteobacteria bacterium]|nr:ammonium transporter [Alphaproteobacteria bacterium]